MTDKPEVPYLNYAGIYDGFKTAEREQEEKEDT